MGYFSLDIKKAKGTSDTTQSDHIERKIIPKNADPTRTHLNRVLVEYPDGVHGRDEAIAHRLNTAGIRRKITHDQVRVVRVVLSGTHEDMMNIQEKGELDEWCSDNIQWLQATFGKDNMVAAHLHMDEKTPHIHAAVVPFVTGERRKAKKEQTDGKRKHRKLSEFTDFVRRYFPYVEKLMPTIKFLRDTLNFGDAVIRKLCTFKDVSIKDELYSREFNQHFRADKTICSLKEDKYGNFNFKIDGVSHVSWFRRKKDEFMKALGVPTRKQDKSIRL